MTPQNLHFDQNFAKICPLGWNWQIKSALVQIMGRCQPMNKPLPEPKMTRLSIAYRWVSTRKTLTHGSYVFLALTHRYVHYNASMSPSLWSGSSAWHFINIRFKYKSCMLSHDLSSNDKFRWFHVDFLTDSEFIWTSIEFKTYISDYILHLHENMGWNC